jgi:uncharacterized membrane protein YvbJ
MKFCQYCGCRNDEEAQTCSKCGSGDLRATPASLPSVSHINFKKAIVVALVASAVIGAIVFLFCAIVWYLNRYNSHASASEAMLLCLFESVAIGSIVFVFAVLFGLLVFRKRAT